MAWIYCMGAECGDDHAAATAVAQHFDGLKWQLEGFETAIGAGPVAGQSGRWWAVVVPSGLSRSGCSSIEEAKRMTRVGLMLYERLRTAPPYRYASAGVEAYDWRDLEDLQAVIDSHSLQGLVLADRVWTLLGMPTRFVPFAPGYRWRPYIGESFPTEQERAESMRKWLEQLREIGERLAARTKDDAPRK